MSLKAELEQWHQAVEYFDEQNYTAALEIFDSIADSAKIHFNIGLILGRKANHTAAIEAYDKALKLDKYLVVAYFQRGVSKMVIQHNPEALDDFNNALKFLRDNEFIDYTQIGLDYKVYTCEVLYNRALCYFCMGKDEAHKAHKDLASASSRVAEERHSWIKKAVDSNGMDCPLYCVPKGVIYRPSASKLKSSKKIDFLGSAKVIASADGNDNFTGFKGALVRKETLKNTPPMMMHQKSMRVKKSTPPPETTGALTRSNTMPVNRNEPSSLPSRMAPSSLQREIANGSFNSMHGRSNGTLSATAHSYRGPNNPNLQTQVSDSEREESDGSSSAFTTPTTGDLTAADMSPDYQGDRRAENSPALRSAMKGPAQSPASRNHVDPLDIIRAGLARRTTLKNQHQKGQRSEQQRPSGPQRSVTLKVPGRVGQDDSGDEDGNYGSGAGQSSGHMRLNPGHLRGNSASLHSTSAQIASTEIIAPVVQRSNTDGTFKNLEIDYSMSGGPLSQYQQQQKQQAMHGHSMAGSLGHEDSVTRGMAAMSVQNTHMPYPSSQTGHIQTYASSSEANTPSVLSPMSADGSGAGGYGSMSNVSAGGLRRAPTKKDAMKVKVHYGSEIINLMVPKHASFDVLHAKIDAKIASATTGVVGSLRIRYMDEDGEAVLMTDDDDFELAKAYAGGDMTSAQTNVVERIELWCSMA
ncbi:hypothetical protein LPJ66_006804 [Kickxella alabastrina]|uniref:Uncharacterized protein n=1 Tax=Kickxella alabastrina TaxID=61397 RepID=A0ACC1IEZ7_9FUNG|nr:hypothetical protein LPJ66_006804 [Kickxella alabastrina]